jgi:hypothetical protein
MNYLIGDAIAPKGVCRLDAIENAPDWAELQKGVRQARLPDDACFRMSPDFKKDKKLADVLANDNNLLVASERTVELLRSLDALDHNDVHEVTIYDHEGAAIEERYFVVHQYDFIRCVDEDQSDGLKSRVNPDEYITVDALVLDESQIDPRRALFRPLEYNKRPFFRRDVADALAAADITGIELFEIHGYDDF